MSAICVIPARGGSKRIPRKNVREFCGQPMIAWPIAAARESGLFDHVLVSTDDEEIAEVAKAAGAEVPFLRPAELSNDHAGTTETVQHALKEADGLGWTYDRACCLYATAAFVAADDLRAAEALIGPDCDFSFAALRFGHPPQRGFTRGPDGAPALVQPEHRSTRTQDLEPVWHDAGQFYWGTREAWLEDRPFFSERTRFVELPPTRAVDIDHEADWALAEAMFRALGRNK